MRMQKKRTETRTCLIRNISCNQCIQRGGNNVYRIKADAEGFIIAAQKQCLIIKIQSPNCNLNSVIAIKY